MRTRKPASLLYSGGKVTVVSHDKWVGHAVYQQEGGGKHFYLLLLAQSDWSILLGPRNPILDLQVLVLPTHQELA